MREGRNLQGMPIRLIIADDQRLFRQSLRIVLEHESHLKVIGEASDGQEAYDWPRLCGLTWF